MLNFIKTIQTVYFNLTSHINPIKKQTFKSIMNETANTNNLSSINFQRRSSGRWRKCLEDRSTGKELIPDETMLEK